jgi:hypothetical protein
VRKTRQNAIESAMEHINVHRTIFFENFFFPVFIGVCGVFLPCDEKCDENKFCRRIIAFYFCACKPEDAQNQFASALRLIDTTKIKTFTYAHT